MTREKARSRMGRAMPASRPPVLPLVFVLLVFCRRAAADDPIVTKAMTASTIAEIYVTQRSVRIELEIGVRDLKALATRRILACRPAPGRG